MTTKKSDPAAHAPDRAAFEAEVERATQHLAAAPPHPAGTQAFPGAMAIFAAIAEFLKQGGIKDQLWEFYLHHFGGGTQPPPEPST